MKSPFRCLVPFALLACLGGCVIPAQAQDSDASGARSDRQIISIGHRAELPAGDSAQQVVSVLGSTIVDGDVSTSAVAVLGDVHVNGTAGENAVAVMGDVYINGKVGGDVVAVLGNVRLGPQAVVGGQITEILGTLQRSPTASVQGRVLVLPGIFQGAGGLRSWIGQCFFYGRPLAPSLTVSWAWWLALATLAFYLLIAAVFRDGVHRCVGTLQTHPGPSILAAFIAVLLVPVVLIALVITIVGIAVIPLFWIALLCAGVFGRVVAIAWLGSRCMSVFKAETGPVAQTVLDVLAGAVLVLALYMVPVLGFFIFVLLGVFGFGAVIYTLLLTIMPAARASRASGERLDRMSGPADLPRGTAGGTATGTASASSASAFAASELPPGTQAGTASSPPGASVAAAPDALELAALPRAGFWIRMLGILIDLVLVGFALGLLHQVAGESLLVLATYAAIMWKLKGTTVGGIVCDLKVVRIGGEPLDWGTAIVRALGCFLSLVVAGLGFFWIAIDREHQAWHDKIAGTVVVRVPKGVGFI
jgi:uncharacterized RDD family membrane protein YckC